MERLVNIAGIITIACIIIISILALVDAYIDMKAMHYSVNNILKDISSSLPVRDTLNKKDIEVVFNSNLVKLESKTNTLLQANTISFLFQIFSFALITIGGYLLLFYNRKFNLIKKNSESITKNELSNQVITYLLYSITLVHLIKAKKVNTASEYLPKLRSYLSKTDEILTKKLVYSDEKTVIVCMNLQEDVTTKLKVLKAKGVHVEDILNTIESIKAHLKLMI